jgi:transposase
MYTRLGLENGRARVRPRRHELGFRWRRLSHCHLQATPEEQAAFRTELGELLAEWPADGKLICVAEATVRRYPTLTAQWCLIDEVPEVPTGDDHTQVHIYGAMAPLTGRTHFHVSPTLGRAEFAQFLQHVLVYYPRKHLLVIHDRGAQHKGAPVEAIVHKAGGRLVLKPQPAYSPERNPQERIWQWVRRVVTHHHGFATLREHIEAIRHVFRYVAGVNAQVRQ